MIVPSYIITHSIERVFSYAYLYYSICTNVPFAGGAASLMDACGSTTGGIDQ